ncbi:unnamed protein product [marine sediment metagenome]|uniref:Uncharacterized protein n=1 Tax=marine sediment metagenome TaxID=412755 RepID=X1B0P5_9ZZZZ
MKIEVKMIPEKNFIKNGDYQKIYWLGVLTRSGSLSIHSLVT